MNRTLLLLMLFANTVFSQSEKYCKVTHPESVSSYISEISLFPMEEGFDASWRSGYNLTGYSNHTTEILGFVNPEKSYLLNITATRQDVFTLYSYYLFFDFDNDGNFELYDSNYDVEDNDNLSSTGTRIYFQAPQATAGDTITMRVRMGSFKQYEDEAACKDLGTGETEDYLIVVRNPTITSLFDNRTGKFNKIIQAKQIGGSLEIENAASENLSLTLRTIEGKKLKTSSTSNSMEIDGVAAGIYLLELKNPLGETVVQKVYIQN